MPSHMLRMSLLLTQCVISTIAALRVCQFEFRVGLNADKHGKAARFVCGIFHRATGKQASGYYFSARH